MMRRHRLNALCLVGLALGLSHAIAVAAEGESDLPKGSSPPALDFPHFPDRLHTFVWRNWPLVEPQVMARVLDTSVENVRAIAESMGLPPAQPISPAHKSRAYITVLRRNWHLLPYEQLLDLLELSLPQLAYSLREDDFLFSKLGNLKPQCAPLVYSTPDATARKHAAEIKQIVEESFGDEIGQPCEPRFAFVEELAKPRPSVSRDSGPRKPSPNLRFIYSYFATYGDPLTDPEVDPFPEGLLQRLADLGVNGVWMHTVLYNLAPSTVFPEFGHNHETRLENLRKLVLRAKKYGISVYLYVNEPRAMPAAFFKDRPGMKGVKE
jgi:hypothetical protein